MANGKINENAELIAKNGFQVAELLANKVCNGISEMNPEDGTYPLFGAIATAGGALRVLADYLAAGKPDEPIRGNAKKEAQLVAALVVARIITPNMEGCAVDFSPRHILASIEAASKITGIDMKPFINPNILEAYSKGVKENGLTLGYWDYLQDVGPDFDGFGDLGKYAKSFSRH